MSTDDRTRTLELALREARRFANKVGTEWETLNAAARQEAIRVQDLADNALGYCGCPDCSAARDREQPVAHEHEPGEWHTHPTTGPHAHPYGDER